MKVLRTTVMASVLALGLALTNPSESSAQGWGFGHGHGHGHFGGFGGFATPVYHPPSFHFDTIYHHDYYHWTPLRGWHSHGHFHTVPHFVPGHFDTFHNGHFHLNPFFHH